MALLLEVTYNAVRLQSSHLEGPRVDVQSTVPAEVLTNSHLEALLRIPAPNLQISPLSPEFLTHKAMRHNK